MLAITTGTVSNFIGKQIIGQAINDASSSIYGSVKSIFNYNSKIDLFIKELDINEKIKRIGSLINNIDTCNNVISDCLNSIHEIIIQIREDLKIIDLKIKKHRKKYFSRFRKFNYLKELNKLKIDNTILESRLDYLIKSLKLTKYYTKNKL